MKIQVFLGGTCGSTTWRRDIAIPALEAAGVTYYSPQLDVGSWTEASERASTQAKAEADVLLFVISGETRGVTTVAEAAYLLAAGCPLALALEYVRVDAVIDECPVTPSECNDLNRGRVFVSMMAEQHGVPVFPTVQEAVQHAIELVRSGELSRLRRTLLPAETVEADDAAPVR